MLHPDDDEEADGAFKASDDVKDTDSDLENRRTLILKPALLRGASNIRPTSVFYMKRG